MDRVFILMWAADVVYTARVALGGVCVASFAAAVIMWLASAQHSTSTTADESAKLDKAVREFAAATQNGEDTVDPSWLRHRVEALCEAMWRVRPVRYCRRWAVAGAVALAVAVALPSRTTVLLAAAAQVGQVAMSTQLGVKAAALLAAKLDAALAEVAK